MTTASKKIALMLGMVALAVVLVFGLMATRRPADVSTFDPMAAHTVWKQEVSKETNGLTASSSADDARRARESLMGLRIRNEDRDLHLELIIALSALERGEWGAFERVREVSGRIVSAP